MSGALLALLLAAGVWAPARWPAQTADAAPLKEFHLYATDGWITMADGTRVYIYGFSDRNEKGTATLPGPPIQVNQGDRVRITLTNIGNAEPNGVHPNHTIHLHGLDVDQANDGVGHTSHEVAHGKSFTYEFTATHAGTYWYHCHVDPTEHIQMGMYGAITVMPPNGEKRAWKGGPAFDRQVTLVLSEVDPAWHKAVRDGKAYDRTDYHPRYFLINGKAAPDLMTDLNSVIQGDVGDRILVRLINAGYHWHAMHMHGFHFEVIASDGRPMPFSWLKDTLSIGPAERYDLLVTLTQKGAYPFHDHNEIAVTNNGAHGGGMHTMVYAGVPVPAAHSHGTHGHGAPGPAGPGHAGHDPADSGHAGHDPADSDHADHDPADPGHAATGDVTVKMRSSLFQPATVTVRAGARVTWKSEDLTAHDVTGDGWASGTTGYGQEYSRVFDKPGTYEIVCSLHPTMVGKVIVTGE